MATTARLKAESESILLRHDEDGICRLTMNRPRQYNALSEAMLDALQGMFDELAEDKSVRAVIIGGEGKAFCAGHDLKEMRADPRQEYYEELFAKCGRMMMSMLRLPQPVIARVHGIATAAGCQMVANADLAVASTEAQFATSGIGVGLFCMTPGVALSRNLGRKDAFEMLFTGEFIPAEKAVSIGLANYAVPPAELDNKVDEMAKAIAGKSQAAISAGKRVFYRQLEMGMEEAYAYAAKEMACNMMFHDAGEGIDAFIGKRKPVWKHK
jgi:enoyl-CoA hydratase/carnithine racemase